VPGPYIEFQSGYGGFTGHSGEVVEELVQGFSTLQIVHQGLKRNTRAMKDWGSTENIRILHNYFVARIHAERLRGWLPSTQV
jgi:hypothetical protein